MAILEPRLRVVPRRGVLPAAAEPPRHPRREPARRALCPEAVGGVADGAVGQSGPAAAEGRRPRCAGRGSRADRRARRGAVDGSRVVPPVRGVPVLRARLLGRVQLLVQGRGGLLDRHDGRVAAERCGAEELLLPLGGVRQPASPEDGQHCALTEPDVPLTGQAQEHGGAGLPGEATGLLHDHDLARESVPGEPEIISDRGGGEGGRCSCVIIGDGNLHTYASRDAPLCFSTWCKTRPVVTCACLRVCF